MRVRVEFLPLTAPGLEPRLEPRLEPVRSGPPWLPRVIAGRPHPTGLGVRVPRGPNDVPMPPTPDPDVLERGELVEALRRVADERLSPTSAEGPALRDSPRDSPRAPLHDATARDGITSSLARLALDSASVVVCGQQPGFFGGAWFDALKTLHTIRLARELERHFARPVIPLYWNHGDDHDASEANAVHLLNENLDVTKIALPSFGATRRPLSGRPVDHDEHRLVAVRAAVRALLPSHTRADDLLDLLMPRPGETLVAARTRAWYGLFARHGLLVLEPDALRAAHGRALSRLVLAHPAAALGRGAARATAADWDLGRENRAIQRLDRDDDSPVDSSPALPALLFRLEAGPLRRAVRPRAGGGWRFDGEDEDAERTDEELAAAVRAEPEAWSAGAFLRPLVQDALLPVAAYVGGPGELRYHALLAELREAAGLPNTPFVPRVSACVTTPAVRVATARLGTTPRAVLTGAFALDTALDLEPHAAPTAVEHDPQRLADALRALAVRHAGELLAHRADLKAIDRGLAQQLKRVVAQSKDLIEQFAGKVGRVADNRRGKLRRHRRRVRALLRPLDQPQERVLGLAALLAAAGTGWLDQLLEELDPFPTETLLVHLGEDEQQAEQPGQEQDPEREPPAAQRESDAERFEGWL